MHKLRLEATENPRLILRLFSQRAYLKIHVQINPASASCHQQILLHVLKKNYQFVCNREAKERGVEINRLFSRHASKLNYHASEK